MTLQGTNISMIRGDTEGILFYVQNKEGNPTPLEVGDTVYFTVKKNTRTSDKLLQKVITEFTDGKALISIDPEDTKDFKYGDYVYDIQLTRASGSVKTVVKPSTFTILGEVTHD